MIIEAKPKEEGESGRRSPEAFLNNLGAVLASDPARDRDLAAILADTLVKSEVADDAVDAAFEAIVDLAARRARPTEGGSV